MTEPANSSSTAGTSRLPEGTHLAYVVAHEAWYRKVVDQPAIQVAAAADGGQAWGFTVDEYSFGAIHVGVFEDAFAAFAQIPEFFAALASEGAATLDDVRRILDAMGAADETDRTRRDLGAPERAEDIIAEAIRRAGVMQGGVAVVDPSKAAAAVAKALSAAEGTETP